MYTYYEPDTSSLEVMFEQQIVQKSSSTVHWLPWNFLNMKIYSEKSLVNKSLEKIPTRKNSEKNLANKDSQWWKAM